MPIWISLLRGINVGGNKRIKMADLRDLYADLGLEGAQTLLQSGNVVFESDQTDPVQLGQHIEAGIQDRYGFESRIILRALDEWRQVPQRNPFMDENFDPSKLLIFLMERMPEPSAVDALLNAHTGVERIHADGQEVYVYYPDGMGRSKLSNVVIEKQLKVAGTGRNWNTVTKLLALAAGLASG
jgi:uncharacterized protein (DUF1697 family)